MYRYIGTDVRTYPYARIDGGTRPLEATPGMDPVDLDEAPNDGQWEEVPAPEVKPEPVKAPTAAKAAAPKE